MIKETPIRLPVEGSGRQGEDAGRHRHVGHEVAETAVDLAERFGSPNQNKRRRHGQRHALVFFSVSISSIDVGR